MDWILEGSTFSPPLLMMCSKYTSSLFANSYLHSLGKLKIFIRVLKPINDVDVPAYILTADKNNIEEYKKKLPKIRLKYLVHTT